MKLFLASFLLMASISTLSTAASPTGKETFIITSSPEYCLPPGCTTVDQELRIGDIQHQYAWINQYKPDGRNLSGVVVPGNLTKSGTATEAIRMIELFKLLKVPYYYGLGSNDYVGNKANDTSNALWQIKWLGEYIENMKKKTGNFTSTGNVYFDFMYGRVGNTSGWAYENGIGSLGYTVELGTQKNIYLIQLNGNANVNSAKFVIDGYTNIHQSRFQINHVADWLKNRLEYAAQFAEANPGSPAKTIVVSMSGTSVDPQIVELLNNYDVRLRFLSNDGSSANCRKPDDMGDQSKFICLGFSNERELQEVELDFDRKNFTVFSRKNDLNQRTKLVEGVFYDPTPKLGLGKFYPQTKAVLFSHKGWYDYVAKVSYVGPDGVGMSEDSGRQNANTLFTPQEIPKDSRGVVVSFEYMPGHVGVPLNKYPDQTELDAAAYVCVATNGYRNPGSRNYYNKVEISTINTSVNYCDYPW
jgi:hypothetical protein